MSKRASVVGAGVFTLIVALMVGGWWLVDRRSAQTVCGFCLRPISARARVVAEVGGHRKTVCCARCVISEAMQQKKPARFISVTDYTSGQTLDPQQAWYVEGSRKVLCTHDMARMNEMKHPEEMAFDRCYPGAYAFARREDADAFVRTSGGVVRRLNEMLAGVPR